jgi:DNA replication and repair protein RecF
LRITHLSLTNFRNYARLELPIPAGMVLLHGDNAQGKTSLLESIYYLATSRSPHITADRQLINWLAKDDPLPHARLVAEVKARVGTRRIEMTLLAGQANGRFKKEIRINGLPRKVMELLGQITVVMFLPQDMVLIEGPPSGRRRYLNITLCQTDSHYCQAVSKYEHALLQRNALLRQLQERRKVDDAQLAFWDDTLAEMGAIIVAGRYRLVRDLETLAQRIHRDLSGAGEHLRLRYQPGFHADEENEQGQMAFDAADMGASSLPELPLKEIAERFRSGLARRHREDVLRGVTGIGPQRDELRLLANGHDLGLYGSRGQNRTAVLALKLAELEWMQTRTGDWPILLLDEVAAELDPHRRAYLMERIKGAEQVLLTTTEPGLLPAEMLEGAARWHVRAGSISVEAPGSSD